MGKRINIILFLLAVFAPVILTDPYHRHLMILFCIFAVLALSLDITMGYLGELPLGHAAFFGIGAYASALLSLKLNMCFWIALPFSGLIAGIMGILIGIPSFRLKGPYFAIVTLGFAQIVHLIVNNWVSFTRGPMGITKIPAPRIAISNLCDITFKGEFSYYYIGLAMLIFSIYITKRLLNSKTGRAILAIRENEDLALSIGVQSYFYKLIAFGIGTALAGMSGSVYAHYFRVISPDLVGVYYLIGALIMVMVGGIGSTGGVILGALIFTVLPETLRVLESVRLIVFAVALLISITFLPAGVIRGVEAIYYRLVNTDKV